MLSLRAFLTEEEAAFVRLVFNNPGAKLNGGEGFADNGTALWRTPERLGLIECIGGYKWKPTELLDIGIVEAED